MAEDGTLVKANQDWFPLFVETNSIGDITFTSSNPGVIAIEPNDTLTDRAFVEGKTDYGVGAKAKVLSACPAPSLSALDARRTGRGAAPPRGGAARGGDDCGARPLGLTLVSVRSVRPRDGSSGAPRGRGPAGALAWRFPAHPRGPQPAPPRGREGRRPGLLPAPLPLALAGGVRGGGSPRARRGSAGRPWRGSAA